MTTTLSAAPLRFGPDGRFELQPETYRLLVDGVPANLGARALDLLFALAAEPGRLLGKHELMDRVWPGLVVEENNLATQVSTLRKLLGGDVIATVPGRGYRFTAPVQAERPADAPPAAEPVAVAARPVTRLPRNLVRLHGRADDLGAVAALVDARPLVTVVGPGGIGKTLLVQHLLDARRAAYPQGVCWVELAATRDPAALPRAIGAALGIRVSDDDPLGTLCTALAPLSILIALDNAEHLVEALAPVVAALLDAAPALKLVVTSQTPLHLNAEVVYRIAPLALPPDDALATEARDYGAVALFVERAQAADARFALNDANAAAVVALCRQLDGLPLAIELAAARAPMLGVEQLAAAMRDRLRLLTSNRNRVAPERQRTLRAALEWSHGLLEPRERTVFRRLAVFAGSSSLEMIRRVVSDATLDGWDVLDGLGDLVDRSLVAVEAGEGEEDDAAPPRYRLLESTRAYALEQLAAVGEEQALRRRHAEALADHLGAQWHAQFSAGVLQRDWIRELMHDADNARSAFDWARASGHAAAALAIGATIMQSKPCAVVFERNAVADACEPLLEAPVDDRLRLHALVALCNARMATRPHRIGESTARAVALARALVSDGADPFELYLALAAHANLCSWTGRLADARAAVDELQALEDREWPPQRRVIGHAALNRLTHMLPGAVAREDSRRLTRRQLELGSACGHELASLLSDCMDAELGCSNAEEAVRIGQRLLAEQAGAGARDASGQTFANLNLGAALLALDRPAEARPPLCTAWSLAPPRELQPFVADHLVLLAALEGRPEAAARLAGYADASYRRRAQSREPNEAAARDRGLVLACEALGAARGAALREQGEALADAEVTALAFAT